MTILAVRPETTTVTSADDRRKTLSLPLLLESIQNVELPTDLACVPSPSSRNYVENMLREKGVQYDVTSLERPSTSYSNLVVAALTAASDRDGQVDVLAMSYVVPEVHASKLPAIAAHAAFPTLTASFGVTETGTIAPFTALRLASTTLLRGAGRRIAMVMMDQDELPAAGTIDARLRPTRAAAVVATFRHSDTPAVHVTRRTGLTAASDSEWSAAVDDMIDDLYAGAGCELPVVLGHVAAGVYRGRHAIARSGAHGAPVSNPWEAAATLPGAAMVIVEIDQLLGVAAAALFTTQG